LDGVGPATARRMVDELGVRTSEGMALRTLLERPPAVPGGAAPGLERLRSALGDCVDETSLPTTAQIERLRTFCEPVFRRRYEAPYARPADIDHLDQLAADTPTRGRFISELTLDPPSSTSDLAGPPLLDEDWLVLSAMHSAKGLEWDVVHVIHAADGV